VVGAPSIPKRVEVRWGQVQVGDLTRDRWTIHGDSGGIRTRQRGLEPPSPSVDRVTSAIAVVPAAPSPKPTPQAASAPTIPSNTPGTALRKGTISRRTTATSRSASSPSVSVQYRHVALRHRAS